MTTITTDAQYRTALTDLVALQEAEEALMGNPSNGTALRQASAAVRALKLDIATYEEAIHGGPVTGTSLGELAVTRSGAGSFQPLAIDLELDAAAGTSDAGDTDFLAPIMGHLLGAYLAGVIGAISVSGARASILPIAALLGQVFDGVTDIDGIVVAHIDGDDPSTATRVAAMFKARMTNNHADSGADYGLDLQDSTPADVLTGAETVLSYAKAALRLGGDVVDMVGEGAPVDGTTGDNYAGPGSRYTDITNANLYLQTGLITSPVWKLVTRAA